MQPTESDDRPFEPVSACKKTAVFQNGKMADNGDEAGSNSQGSLGLAISQTEGVAGSLSIGDDQLCQKALNNIQTNQSEIARILEDSRTHDDIQEFSDLFI